MLTLWVVAGPGSRRSTVSFHFISTCYWKESRALSRGDFSILCHHFFHTVLLVTASHVCIFYHVIQHLKQKQFRSDCECVHKFTRGDIPNFFSCSCTEPRGYSEMISHVGVDGFPDSSINCHRTLSATHSASIVGTLQRTER